MKKNFYFGFVLILALAIIGIAIGGGITLILKSEPVLGICAILCAVGCCPYIKYLWDKTGL